MYKLPTNPVITDPSSFHCCGGLLLNKGLPLDKPGLCHIPWLELNLTGGGGGGGSGSGGGGGSGAAMKVGGGEVMEGRNGW